MEAPITAVTVFTDGARVQRTGTTSVAAGRQTVEVTGLPAGLDPASVRVTARGAGLALLNVEVRRGYAADPVREQVARLRAETERCRDAVQALDDEDTAEEARLKFLIHLSGAAATALARAVGFGRAGHDELTSMAGYLSGDTAEVLGRRRDIAVRRRAARRELEAAEGRLAGAEKRVGQATVFSIVAATLEAGAVADGALENGAVTPAEVEVSYHVAGASWRPLYDLTLEGERLAVSYLAEVTQQTGEDWPAVELTLSTTRRGRHQVLPELDPWYVRRALPPSTHIARRGPMRAMSGGPLPPPMLPPQMAAPGAPADVDVGGGAAEAAMLSAEPVGAGGAGQGEAWAGVAYRVQRPLAVPANGGPQKTSIARFDLDATLDHLTVPVLAPEAYLRATATNTSSLLLLPGPARVFHGTQFTGETTLDTVAAGEEIELQLGVDDQVRVERELKRRSTGKAVIGGTRTIDIGYEITVENHRRGPARVTVKDRVPVSADGDIKVRLREASPAPAEQSDLGELTWKLKLDGGQAASVRYRFTVEHPAQVVVTGL
jgi:uncharacterized protein (TIGR02231 family)